jgi:hypothetical protein
VPVVLLLVASQHVGLGQYPLELRLDPVATLILLAHKFLVVYLPGCISDI